MSLLQSRHLLLIVNACFSCCQALRPSIVSQRSVPAKHWIQEDKHHAMYHTHPTLGKEASCDMHSFLTASSKGVKEGGHAEANLQARIQAQGGDGEASAGRRAIGALRAIGARLPVRRAARACGRSGLLLPLGGCRTLCACGHRLRLLLGGLLLMLTCSTPAKPHLMIAEKAPVHSALKHGPKLVPLLKLLTRSIHACERFVWACKAPAGSMSLSMGSAAWPCPAAGPWAATAGPASCCCIGTALNSPLQLALGCSMGAPWGDDMPGGVPGASASREMAAADSELLREAMGWLEGGVTGRALPWLALPMPYMHGRGLSMTGLWMSG